MVLGVEYLLERETRLPLFLNLINQYLHHLSVLPTLNDCLYFGELEEVGEGACDFEDVGPLEHFLEGFGGLAFDVLGNPVGHVDE